MNYLATCMNRLPTRFFFPKPPAGSRILAAAVIIGISCGGLLFAGSEFALEPGAQSALSKRQAVKECMSRQMAANKTLSYIEATKACADRVKSQSDGASTASQLKQ